MNPLKCQHQCYENPMEAQQAEGKRRERAIQAEEAC